MKFKSPVYTEASGSIGGIVYSHNTYGMYTRARAIPTNPNTVNQQRVRAAMNNAQQAWVALSDADKSAWNTYGAATPVRDHQGNQIFLTGRAHYIRNRVLRTAAGIVAFGGPPVLSGLATMTPPVPTVTAPTALSIAFTNTDPWATVVGGHLEVFASRPQNITRNFFRGPYLFAGKVDGAVVPPTSPAALVLPFTYSAGQRCFVRCIATDAEGRLSEATFPFDDAS